MDSVIRFVANDVVPEPRAGFVGFADNKNKHYLWMQPGEMTTAKDGVWLERDDQAWGGSGGNWNVVLTRNTFTVITSELTWMACDAVEIEFVVDDSTYEGLKQLLKRVTVECPWDLVIRE
jgi:hypothetical protein